MDKAGRDKDYWLKQWDDTRTKSLVRGNTYHDLREEITNNRGTELFCGKPFRVRNKEMLVSIPHKDWLDGVYTEELLWHHVYGIAGRADKIYLDTDKKDRHRLAHIEDYKTSKRIRFRSFIHPVTGPKMMKEPISHLEDCEATHYSLQLSLYALMLEYLGFAPGQRIIIHLPHVPEMAPPGAKPPPPIYYPMPYLKKEVISMLDYLKHRRVI